MKKLLFPCLLASILLLSSCMKLPLISEKPSNSESVSESESDTESESASESESESASAESIDGVTVDVRGIAVTVAEGHTLDLTPYLGEYGALSLVSECEAVAAVDGYTVTGRKIGRTQLSGDTEDGDRLLIEVTVEFPVLTDGFTVKEAEDKTVYTVDSVSEADRLLDAAIVARLTKITVDFSSVGNGFVAADDYSPTLEFSYHVALSWQYETTAKNRLYFTVDYRENAASSFSEITDRNETVTATNANLLARRTARAESAYRRSDDFDAFPITKEERETYKVYNSEELWWALSYGYLPTFPEEGSRAELYYERAKMILRDIITEDMTDREKVIAIYDYLVSAVTYDYDAYETPDTEDTHGQNMAYYLEGVFERGRAVCDGKTKAFILLCGIEGISCLRDFGFQENGAGHAWNYVLVDGAWYLVDTTFGDLRAASEGGIGGYFGESLEYHDYDPLFAPIDYHKDSYAYSGIFEGISEREGIFPSIDTLDTELYGTSYDFIFQSEAEAAAVLSLALEGLGEDSLLLVFRTAPLFSPQSVYSVAEEALLAASLSGECALFAISDDTYYLAVKNIAPLP